MSELMTMPERKCRFEDVSDGNFIELIRLVPLNPFVRALILKLTAKLPPADCETFEQLKEWVETHCEKRARLGVKRSSGEDGISISVEFSETEYGRADYSVPRWGTEQFHVEADDLLVIFEGFARLSACALAVQTREAEYLAEVKHWDKVELQQFAQVLGALTLEMESHPFEDRLGCCYLEFAVSSQGQRWKGEFHTPKTVCDLIGALTLGDVEALPANGPITICEPACGAGAMILSLAANCPPEMRRRLRVTAVDINRTACDMTFINTTLWGVATRVIHGDSLGMKYWAAWSNIHHLSPAFPMAGQAFSSAARGQGHPPAEAEVEQLKAALGQQMLVWD